MSNQENMLMKPVKNREDLVKLSEVTLKNYWPSFGLIEFEEIDGKLCYDDKVHYSFLWPMYENNILKNGMKFNVKFVNSASSL